MVRKTIAIVFVLQYWFRLPCSLTSIVILINHYLTMIANESRMGVLQLLQFLHSVTIVILLINS